MAKILGVQLKSVKMWEAREGYGVSANIYVDNKKVGRFYDAGDGGMSDISCDNREFYDVIKGRAKKYFKNHPPITEEFAELKAGETIESRYDFLYTSEAFIEEVLELTQREKSFKNLQKKGCPFLLHTDYPFLAKGPHPIPQAIGWASKEAHAIANKWIAKEKAKFPHLITTIYSTLDDFIINE